MSPSVEVSNQRERALEKYNELVSKESPPNCWTLTTIGDLSLICLNNHIVYIENDFKAIPECFHSVDTLSQFKESCGSLAKFLEERKSRTVTPLLAKTPCGEGNLLEMVSWREHLLKEVEEFDKDFHYQLQFSFGKRLFVWEMRFGGVALITEYYNAYGQEGYDFVRDEFIHNLKLMSEA